MELILIIIIQNSTCNRELCEQLHSTTADRNLPKTRTAKEDESPHSPQPVTKDQNNGIKMGDYKRPHSQTLRFTYSKA